MTVALRPPSVCGHLRANNSETLSFALHALSAEPEPPRHLSTLNGLTRALMERCIDDGEGSRAARVTRARHVHEGRCGDDGGSWRNSAIRSAGRSSPSKRLDVELEFRSALLDPLSPSASFLASADFDPGRTRSLVREPRPRHIGSSTSSRGVRGKGRGRNAPAR